MTYGQILESPDGKRLVITVPWLGKAEITPNQIVSGAGLPDLWNLAIYDLGDNFNFDPELDTDGWHVVAEVDDTNEAHFRIYPERFKSTAGQYLTGDWTGTIDDSAP